MAGACRYCVSTKLCRSSSTLSFSAKRPGCFRSCTRSARRAILSSYAGPMPRPVVPIFSSPPFSRSVSRATSSAAWNEVQRGLDAVDDQRVAGVVAALEAHHALRHLGQPVDQLALAFVTPLGADHNDVAALRLRHDLLFAKKMNRE